MNIHIKARTVPYILVLGGKEKKKKKKEKKKKKRGKYIEKSQRICRASIYVEFGLWMEDTEGARKARFMMPKGAWEKNKRKMRA